MKTKFKNFFKWIVNSHKDAAYEFQKNTLELAIYEFLNKNVSNRGNLTYDWQTPSYCVSDICNFRTESEIKLIFFELTLFMKKQYSNIINLRTDADIFYNKIFETIQQEYPEAFPNNMEEYNNYALAKKAFK